MAENLLVTTTKIMLGAFVAGLVLATSLPAQELDGTLKKIKTLGTFTIGYRDAAPPFFFFRTGQAAGRLLYRPLHACRERRSEAAWTGESQAHLGAADG